jgi:hypothetical protein
VKGDLSGPLPLSRVAMDRYDSESNKTPSHWVLESRFSLIEYDWESDGSMLEEGGGCCDEPC